MTQFKYLVYSLVIVGFINAVPAGATNPEENDESKAPARPTKVSEISEVKKGKKARGKRAVKTVEIEQLAAKPEGAQAAGLDPQTVGDALKLSEHAAKITELINAFKSVGVSNVQKWLIGEEAAGTVTSSVGPFVGLVEGVVGLFPAKKGTGCYKCEQGCFSVGNKTTKAADAIKPIINDLETLTPIMNDIISKDKTGSAKQLYARYLKDQNPKLKLSDTQINGIIGSLTSIGKTVPAKS